MHRIYCPDSNFSVKEILVRDKDELHHVRNVLRLKKNATVELFNGQGAVAAGKLFSISAKQAVVEIDAVEKVQHSKPVLILACAIPKKSKFEMIVEKATELGVDEIIPMITERTEVKLKGEKQLKKISRYQAVAVNASKQSKRVYVPTVHPTTGYPQILKKLTQSTTAIIPSLTDATENLLTALHKLKQPDRISFMIGPEGDFTSEEYTLARQSGCHPVTLGDKVLKVETAAICALSCAHLTFRA